MRSLESSKQTASNVTSVYQMVKLLNTGGMPFIKTASNVPNVYLLIAAFTTLGHLFYCLRVLSHTRTISCSFASKFRLIGIGNQDFPNGEFTPGKSGALYCKKCFYKMLHSDQ